ncbi:MAG: DNA mismatch repair endonuclease MutL [Clostridia bacterium]|nr:DNA mismatch repair endonuclease MutL [Clostridia bacterium]
MAKINVLDSSIYNLIAAGEVVEKPASVVKELIENSIDAGAKNIKVEILDGGIKEIRVTDDGSGIEKEYLTKAFLPHATSKIEKASDLDNIFTLGFRGEALASIAAVSNVKMTSKVANEELGNTITLSAGKIVNQSAIGAANGTTIVVSDLFFNVPARAKFLRKAKSEEQDITNIIERVILANPALNISYYADGKQVLASQGKTLKEAMYSVYGKQVLTETLEVSGGNQTIKVFGYIGRPSYSKPNRTYQTVIVNGRYILNQTISTAVANAYGEMLMKRRYPFFVLKIDVDPTVVDVNVHPNKLEVRFSNAVPVYSVVYDAVSRALSEMDYVLEVDTSTGEVTKRSDSDIAISNTFSANSAESERTKPLENVYMPTKSKEVDKAGVNLNPFADLYNINSQTQKEQLSEKILDSTITLSSAGDAAADGFGIGSKLIEKLASSNSTQPDNEFVKPKATQQSMLQSDELNRIKIKTIGKLFNTYILIEYGDNLYMIDQHAAHERILYEKFTKEYNAKRLVIQPLMFPYILTVNPTEFTILSECLDQMRELGFDIDEFGDRTFKVSALPMLLSDLNFDMFFEGFLSETKSNLSALKQSDMVKEKLMQHSCKSAVKAGNDLSNLEIETLFKEMNNEKIPLFCPHGRPIAVRVTKTEIEKWFKRIV